MLLQGKDDEGRWKTTAAKAYPRNINLMLVEALIQRCIALASTPIKFSDGAFSELERAYVKITAAMAVSGHHIGNDYAS